MQSPALFLGTADSGALYEANRGQADDGEPFRLRMRSNRLAPNGLVETATYSHLTVTTQHLAAQALAVRLFVDDEMVCERVLALPAQSSVKQYSARVPFSLPLLVNGVERGRVHPRGTWAQIELESDGTSPVTIDGVELEWDPAGRL
jgi:hypothetical protein